MTNPTEQIQQVYVVDGFAILATSEEEAIKALEEFHYSPQAEMLREAMKPVMDFIEHKQREIDYRIDQELNAKTGE
jgi:hypothetical protein